MKQKMPDGTRHSKVAESKVLSDKPSLKTLAYETEYAPRVIYAPGN